MSMVGRKGTIITVFSTAYAVGKTLIAINMAAELAKSRPAPDRRHEGAGREDRPR